MKAITTQEILGSHSLPKQKDAIIAYFLSTQYLAENKEEEVLENEAVLLIGNYVSKEESNHYVQKFVSFCFIPLFTKEQALSFWQSKINKEFKNSLRKEKENGK